MRFKHGFDGPVIFAGATYQLGFHDMVVTNDYKRFGDSSVVLDIESGAEKGRATLNSLSQGVVFSSPGWARDFYYLTFSSVSRVEVR